MPNRAALWRAKVATETGRERPVVQRARHGLTVDLGGGKRRLLQSVGPVHTRDGREIDTDLDTDKGGWLARGRSLDFDVRVGAAGKRQLLPRPDRPNEWVEIGRPEWFTGRWQNVPFRGGARRGHTYILTGSGYTVALIVTPTGMRAEWTVEDPALVRPFRWPLTLSGLTYRTGSNTLTSDEDGQTVLYLGRPRWQDAASNTGNIPFTWDGEYLTYTPTLPPDAVFPVLLDPDFGTDVGADANDGYVYSTTFDSTGGWVVGKNAGGTVYYGWLRFPNIAIPHGSTISDAHCDLKAGSCDNSPKTRIYVIAEDNHAAPTSKAEWDTDHANHTTNYTDWNFSGISGWTATPSFHTAVQEWLDRANHQSGYALGVHIDDNSSAKGSCCLFNGADSDPAEIDITYTPPWVEATLGSPSRTRTAQPVTVTQRQTVILGSPSRTRTAQPLTVLVPVSHTLGSPSRTRTAQPVNTYLDTLTVQVRGVEQQVLDGTLRIEEAIQERSTLTVIVEHEPGHCTPGQVCVPQGARIDVIQGDTPLFAGAVERSDDSLHLPAGTVRHRLTAKDWHYLADRRIVAASYVSVTAGAIVGDMISKILAGEGITAGNVQDGPTVSRVVFAYVPCSQALDLLAERAGFIWWITPDRALHFEKRGSTLSPWTVGWDDLDGIPAVTHNNPGYRNRQIIRGGWALTDPQVESFRGDGERKSFTVAYPIAREPDVVLNSGTATVGIRGVEEGFDWYWNKGTEQISQDPAGSAIADTDVLAVTYVGMYPMVAISEDAGEVARIAALEGVGSGRVEVVDNDSSVESREASFEAAAARIAYWAQDGLAVRFTTRRQGLRAGQTVTLDLPGMGLEDRRFLLTGVEMGREYGESWWNVEAVQGPVVASWAKAIGLLGEQPLLVNVSEEETIGLEDTVNPEGCSWAEQVDGYGTLCPLPGAAQYPAADLYPC